MSAGSMYGGAGTAASAMHAASANLPPQALPLPPLPLLSPSTPSQPLPLWTPWLLPPAPAPAPSNASIASLVVDLLCSGACVRVARTPAVCGSSREVGANAGVGVAKDGAMACTAADCRGGPGAASDAVPGAAEDAPRASNEPPVPPPPVPPKPLRPMLPAPPEPPAPLSPAPPPPPAPLPSASPKPTSSFCSSSNASDGASRCAGKLCSAPPALVNGRRGSGSGGASAAGRWSAPMGRGRRRGCHSCPRRRCRCCRRAALPEASPGSCVYPIATRQLKQRSGPLPSAFACRCAHCRRHCCRSALGRRSELRQRCTVRSSEALPRVRAYGRAAGAACPAEQ
eukprot:366355-Chlamydomonas_euryale.AAC.16